MSELTTEAGQALHDASHPDDSPCLFGIYGTCEIGSEIAAIEREAAAQAEARVRELERRLRAAQGQVGGMGAELVGVEARLAEALGRVKKTIVIAGTPPATEADTVTWRPAGDGGPADPGATEADE